ncbi:hypothetical protein [Nannocystis exedens]|nr:hypothetical protein [Nannocystis exedens]
MRGAAVARADLREEVSGGATLLLAVRGPLDLRICEHGLVALVRVHP